MVVHWRNLARHVDAACDNVWGEPVRLIPWTEGELSDGGPDDTRTAVNAVGFYRSASADSASGGGSAGGFQSKEVVSNVVLSIRKEPVLLAQLRTKDRVEWLDRGETMEVGFIGDEPTDRWEIPLIRKFEGDE
jgi:hypothetical protein